MTASYYIGEATPTCSNDALVMSEKTTGTVKKGSGANEYLMDIDGVYETLSELGFYLLYACQDYHTAGVEFDLMTSECPDLQETKQSYEFGVFYVNNIDFYDTHLVSSGLTFTLINDNGCEADPLPPVDDKDKDNNSSSTWIIILVVVIVIVIVIVVVVLILFLRKKGNHELKVVNGSKAPKNSQTPSKPVTITIPGPQPVVPPNMPNPEPAVLPNMPGPQPAVSPSMPNPQPAVLPNMPNPQPTLVPTMPSPAVLSSMPGSQPVVLIPIGAAPQPSRIPLPTNLPTQVIKPSFHPSA